MAAETIATILRRSTFAGGVLVSRPGVRVTSQPAANGFDAPVLGEAQQGIVDSLREHGIAVVRFDDLFGDDLWQELAADIGPFVEETEEKFRDVAAAPESKSEIIARRFHVKKQEKHVFPIDGPWLRFAASETMVDIANAYRGLQTKLFYLDNWFTVPYAGADDRIASQRWHRDPDDSHVIKVFTYFSDVDESAGPFEYVRSSAPGLKYGSLFPWPDNEYPPQDELVAAIDPADVMTLTGPPRTMVFAVTSGFHRGGFARLKPRVLSICTYVSPDAPKQGHRFSVDFEGRESEVAPQVRFALR